MKTINIQEIELIGDTSVERVPSQSLIDDLFDQAILWNARQNRRQLHHALNGPTCETRKQFIYG